MPLTASLFSPGTISVTVEVERGASSAPAPARRILVESTRPTGLAGALFSGRSAADVPALVARMHALCGRSHMVAAEVAIVAAMGRDVDAVVSERFDTLVGERLGEHLRSLVTGNGPTRVDLADREVLADVRAVLASVHALGGATHPAGELVGADVHDRIRHSLERLGFGIDRLGRFRPGSGSWAEEQLDRVGLAPGDVWLPCDRLAATDDDAVVAALAADPKGFATLPRLPGRRPETGPTARATRGPGLADGRARLLARLGEIAEAAELLQAPVADRDRIAPEWVTSGRLDDAVGWAAVESPRGRLHHVVRLDGNGRIAAFAMLAPTEWNFHPDGPLVATLMANRWSFDPGDLDRAHRITGLFDPCVAFDVRIAEGADA